MPRVSLLHLSDLHFADQPFAVQLFPKIPSDWHPWLRIDSHDPAAADAAAHFAVANSSRLHVVVVSGDLATTGRRQDLDAARDYVDGSLGPRRAAGDPVLLDAGLPVVLIPGNHDRFGNRFSPGSRAFDAVFVAYWSAGQRLNGVQRLWDDSSINGRVNVVLLGADLTLVQRDYGGNPLQLPSAGRFGRGRVYPGGRRTLETETQQIRSRHPNCVAIWVIHFEPHCHDTFLKLLNEQSLLRAAQQEGVPLVLCGHSHRSSARPIGNCLFSVCGTTSQAHAADGNHLHVVDIDVNPPAKPSIRILPYRFDPQQPGYGFVAVPS